MHVDHETSDFEAMRSRFTRMNWQAQKIVVGVPAVIAGFVTGLLAAMIAPAAAIWVGAVAAYSILAFGYAWMDERQFLFSSQDMRSRTRIVLIHLAILLLLLGSIRAEVQIYPLILLGKGAGAAVLVLILAVMGAEIQWLSGNWLTKHHSGLNSRQ
jgi:hypothetical protein